MNKQEYLELVRKELKDLSDLIERKNADYTGGSDDPFANFKVTEQLGLSDARVGVLIRMVDKIQRLRSFIEKGELKVKDESATDAARDICGYALILIGMLEAYKSDRVVKAAAAESLPPGNITRALIGCNVGRLCGPK